MDETRPSNDGSPPPPAMPGQGMSPSVTPALVLAVLSIVLNGCFVIGLVLGFIGLAHVGKAERDLKKYPNSQGEGMVVAAKVCSIIGIILGCLQGIFWLVYLVIALVAELS